ncbi:MAG TPA: hypothetical protein VHW23_39620 [Kofleriaceae bacterium]|jgi:hypothetical protein|nr:hypothetical protein [Kofleriaceae bacterium]
MTRFHPIRRATAAVTLAALISALATRASRADDPPALPPLPEITPAELKELANNPTCNCRKPTADEQKALDADPVNGLGKLGAITEDDLKGALDELQATQKDLNDRYTALMSELQLGSTIEPKYHVHVTYRLLAPKPVPVNTVVLHGVPFSALEPYYRARPPANVQEGLITIDGLIKGLKDSKDKQMKAEPTLRYLSEAELDALVAQTDKMAPADDQEMVLGARAYKQTVDGKTIYTLFVGKKVGIAYRFHEDLARVQHWEPKLAGIGGLRIYEAVTTIDNMGFGNVTTAEWYAKANARVLEVYKTEKDGLRDLMIYEILSALPLSGTLIELEKVVNSANGASWGKLGLNFFRDVGLVTIFLPGGTAFAIGMVADGIAVVLAFALDEKDKWSQLAWTAGAAGVLVAARVGSILRAVVRLVKLGKMQVPKAYAAAVAAYQKYLAALARWRELRKKPCLKVVKAPPPPPPPAPPTPLQPGVPPADVATMFIALAPALDGFAYDSSDPTGSRVASAIVSGSAMSSASSTRLAFGGDGYGGSGYGGDPGSGSGDGSGYGGDGYGGDGSGGGSDGAGSGDGSFVWVVPPDSVDGCTCDLGWTTAWYTTGLVPPPPEDTGPPPEDVDAEIGPEVIPEVCGDGLCSESACSLDCTTDDGTVIDGSDASWLGAGDGSGSGSPYGGDGYGSDAGSGSGP